MPSVNFVYRGCQIDIDIVDCAVSWNISIRVTPFDGVELIEPFGSREMKLAKIEDLDVIQDALVEEVCVAIDHRLVGC